MFYLLIIFYLLSSTTLCSGDLNRNWNEFKLKYNKTFKSPQDEAIRKSNFAKTLKLIDDHNMKQRSGLLTFEIGINEYSDMTDQEFNDIFLNSNMKQHENSEDDIPIAMIYTKNAPKNLNWIELGYKNPVLNQKNCGSCYTFGAIAAIEAQYLIHNKTLLQLSHQEVLDCSKSLGNNGCNGGLTSRTLQYALESGIGLEQNNPYLASEDECRKTEPRLKIHGLKQIETGDESALKEAVATIGPVAFGFDAIWPSFRHYKAGIYYESECNNSSLSHAMVIVGYGQDEGQDYWLVRNSWGQSWGEQGHIRVTRNRQNHCGIASRALFPIL